MSRRVQGSRGRGGLGVWFGQGMGCQIRGCGRLGRTVSNQGSGMLCLGGVGGEGEFVGWGRRLVVLSL
jgi:hypothetical protein